MEPTTFGALLRRYRMAAGLTQEKVAERANLSARAISDLERGLSRTPRYDTLNLLANALNLSAEQHAALFAAARPPLPQAETTKPPTRPLPLPPTALLGREREIDRAIMFLEAHDVRLLTITGPGGVGKTRLALEIAHTLHDRYADGLAWVDLTALRDPSLVAQTVAQALGLREPAEAAFADQVRALLQEKQFLLLLDNFEHLLGAANVVADLLSHCPHLHVLVTSRIPLHVRAEQQLALSPLAHEAAVALFNERAQRVQPDLDDASPIVGAICDRVDHLPLAIEIAAAHVKALPLPLLLARLTNRLHVLHSGARDLPERQQTMREAIAWSYNLLPPTWRRWFRALGSFAGGCTLAAVEVICRETQPLDTDEAFVVLAALVDASLVQMTTTRADMAPRYSMLAVIHEYAREQAAIMGEMERDQRRHAEYYATLAEDTESAGPGQEIREEELLREDANGRAALDWAYEHRETALGLRLATWFGRLWMTRGRMSEGNLWLERMLALDETGNELAAPPAIRARALYWAARLAMHLGEADRAERFAREALSLARRTEDHADISTVLAMLGTITLTAGDEVQAATYFEESAAVAKRAGDAVAIGLALLNLGELARMRGEFTRATVLLEEALACVCAIDLIWGIANIHTLLGRLARQQQDYTRAKARYRESLTIYKRLGNATFIAWCLESIADVACAQECHHYATRLCAAAATMRAAAGTPLPPAEQDTFDRVVMTTRAELDEDCFAQEWSLGATMTQADVATYALTQLAM